MSVPTIPRHELAALRIRAVLATAALSHFHHDHTGRAHKPADNDCSALRDRTEQAPAAMSLPVGAFGFHSFHEADNAA